MITRLSVETKAREQLLDVTGEVAKVVTESGVQSGVVTVFVPHTTAGATINESADPAVVEDILEGLRRMVPQDQSLYRHTEGNSDAHLKTSLVGSSVRVPVEGGQLLLGTWQGIYFCEFDGPRSRKLWVKVESD